MEIQSYSHRLGTLTAQQFQAALDRFQLGTLIQAEPVRFGNIGQNVFVSSTKGEFVLRGAPLDAAQFPGERWFMQQLHEHTRAPVPWPYLLDQSTDIFGWNYVLMPRLPGLSLADREAWQKLSDEARRSIAHAMGAILAELHSLTWICVGNYDPNSDSILSAEISYPEQVLFNLHRALESCSKATPRTTGADREWVDEIIAQGYSALHAPFQPCFVHGDYQESNVVVEDIGGEWKVSGVFDMYPGFSDPETDLPRQLAAYLDEGASHLAKEFLRAYHSHRPFRPDFEKRFPLYMLQDRLSMWEWAHREKRIWWDESLTFRGWAERFTSAWHLL